MKQKLLLNLVSNEARICSGFINFKTCLTLIKSAMVAIAFFATIVAAKGQNILQNSGFEEWSESQPVMWHGDKSTISQINVKQVGTPRTGLLGLNLINTSTIVHQRYTSENYFLDTSKGYQLTYYVKGVGRIRNSFYDGEQSYSGFCSYSEYLAVDGDTWQEVIYRFRPGKQTLTGQLNVQIVFSILGTDATTGLIVDDVSLLELSPTKILTKSVSSKIFVKNPVRDNIELVAPDAVTSVSVYSLTGSVLVQVSSDNDDKEITIPAKKIAKGVYVVVVKLKDGTSVTTKVVKQ